MATVHNTLCMSIACASCGEKSLLRSVSIAPSHVISSYPDRTELKLNNVSSDEMRHCSVNVALSQQCACVCVAGVGFGGSKLWAPRVLLVMTHSDLDSSSSSRDKELYEQLVKQYTLEVILEPHIFRLDANQAMGAEMKLLRQTIANIKKQIVEV